MSRVAGENHSGEVITIAVLLIILLGVAFGVAEYYGYLNFIEGFGTVRI